jgi:hypothetical protein
MRVWKAMSMLCPPPEVDAANISPTICEYAAGSTTIIGSSSALAQESSPSPSALPMPPPLLLLPEYQ